MAIIEELHDKCYKFASMRDCLHRLRAWIFDLLTQLRDSEERIRVMIETGEEAERGRKEAQN